MEETMWRQANFDDITGLPSRSLFRDRVEQALAAAARGRHRVSLLFIAVTSGRDRNSGVGTARHDDLLRRLGKRLVGCLREADTVTRIGETEFVVMLPVLERCADVERVAEKLARALVEPIRIGDEEIALAATAGSACFPEDGESIEELLRSADAAMFHAIEEGATYAAFRSKTVRP